MDSRVVAIANPITIQNQNGIGAMGKEILKLAFSQTLGCCIDNQEKKSTVSVWPCLLLIGQEIDVKDAIIRGRLNTLKILKARRGSNKSPNWGKSSTAFKPT